MKKILEKVKYGIYNLYYKLIQLLISLMMGFSTKLMEHLILLNKDDKFKLTFKLFDMPPYNLSKKIITKLGSTSYKLIDPTLEANDLNFLEKSLNGQVVVREDITDDAKSERVKVKFKPDTKNSLKEEYK